MDIQLGSIEEIIAIVLFVFSVGAAWATLKSSVKNVENAITDEIKPTLSELRDRFFVVEDRVESLWKDKVAPGHSIRKLNTVGRNILFQSGIKAIVDNHKNELRALLNAKQPATEYDAENAAISLVLRLPNSHPELVPVLKYGAFKVGAEMNLVLFVGGIYFRDQVLATFNKSLQ